MTYETRMSWECGAAYMRALDSPNARQAWVGGGGGQRLIADSHLAWREGHVQECSQRGAKRCTGSQRSKVTYRPGLAGGFPLLVCTADPLVGPL
jgi:hypothetical protein